MSDAKSRKRTAKSPGRTARPSGGKGAGKARARRADGGRRRRTRGFHFSWRLLLTACLVLAFGVGMGLVAGYYLGGAPHERKEVSASPERTVSVSPIVKRPAKQSEPRIFEEYLPPRLVAPEDRLAPLSVPRLSEEPAKSPSAGLPAWERFAALAPEDTGRPRIAVVIDDVGHNPRRAGHFIDLDPAVTLAFLPYVDQIGEMARRARAKGHEILVHLPMEPSNDKLDAGANALLTGLDEAELRRRIAWNLDRFDGYVGVNNHMGSRFTADRRGMELVMSEMERRGLLFLDSRTSADSVGYSLAREFGVPGLARDIFLDNEDDLDAILVQFAKLEKVASRHGVAVAIGHPHENTLEALRQWLPAARARGFQLVPITAIVRQKAQG